MLIYFAEFDKALEELERAKRLDPFSHDLIFGPEATCHYWLDNPKEALQTFKKVKVKKNYLFYMALTYKKIGDNDQASEILREAHALTGMDNDSFIGTQPFKDQDILSTLKNQLSEIQTK